MTTETETELVAYGVQVSCFPALGGEVAEQMRLGGFFRYRACDQHYPEASILAFVHSEPIMLGSSPLMPALPQSATASTRYVPIITALVGPIARNWQGEYMAGLCGTSHELDEGGRTGCFRCFKIAIESGRFCG